MMILHHCHFPTYTGDHRHHHVLAKQSHRNQLRVSLFVCH